MTIKELLTNEKNARKIFGKREIEIILKQIEGERLTQSEKNRLSRDIRPKLEFIKKVSEFKDEFDLKKSQRNKSLIEKAVDIILKDHLNKNISAVLLFGSFADKTFTRRSDIDICVVFDSSINIKEASKFRIRILGELSNKLDIQVFNILPQKLKRSIARNHILLYKRKDFDNINFSIKYLKDEDYALRLKRLFNETN